MVTPDTALSAGSELDAGFKAAKAWFFDNEIDREKREQALARKMARLLRIRPQVLYGKIGYTQERLETVEEQAAAEGWSDEMRKIELRRARSASPSNSCGRYRGCERAISAAQRDRDLPRQVMAALPAALSRCGRTIPTPGPRRARLCMRSSSCWRASTVAA